jgi:nucleotide-binding universal stress UspA family protein
MVATIFVPLDGSTLAEQALPYAEDVAERTSARIVLSRVLPASVQPAEDDLACRDAARAYLQTVAARLVAKGLDVTSLSPRGDPAGVIVEQVHSTRADLVVMATHGRSGPGRRLYGSVTDQVLRTARVPVLVVPPGSAGPIPRILVALDGSSLSEVALGPAEDLAISLGASIVLLQIIKFPPYALFADSSAYVAAFEPDVELAAAQDYLEGVAARLRLKVGDVRVRAELGQPNLAIADIARQEHAGLIAMATHGRSGLARLVLGSVATGTLQHSRVPLLLVRPAGVQAELVRAEADHTPTMAVPSQTR